MIQSLATQQPVRMLCRLLEVAPSGYYQWRKKVPGPRAQANQQLLSQIRRAFAQSRQTYGSPRITRQLQRQQIPCSENRVARLMQNHQLQAKSKRPFRPRTTHRRPDGPIAPNRLKNQSLTRPNQVWVADITYISTATGWAYLAAVMDLFSRKIVGWAIGYTLHASLVKDALQLALQNRRPPPGLLHHSDRGMQYASRSFQDLLHAHQLVASMSGRGHCYDNAAMESFWSTLKTELVHRQSFTNVPQACSCIAEYINGFYNQKRLHSALDYHSPVDFERQLTYI